MKMHKWRNGELEYCFKLVRDRGDDKVGRDPKNIASYLRLQAALAFRDEEYEITARLGAAATAINHDARNNHAPNWQYAQAVLS